MKARTSLRLTAIGIALVAGATAQTLIGPGREAAARAAFESAAGADRLRCEFQPHFPALDYSLRFQTGFLVDIPLKELNYRNHDLNVFLRVTPQGRPPVYLATSASIRNTEGIKGDVQLTSRFVVGEGNYAVEALVADEEPRVCFSQWRIEAQLSPNERELTGVAGAVEEAASFYGEPSTAAAPPIDRLTLLVHATSFHRTAAGMEPELVKELADSLYSLLTQLPARSVRLTLFNLDKNVVLLSKDPFRLPDLAEVIHACEQLQLFAVSVKDLQRHGRSDVLSDLLVKETRDPDPAGAVILIGPRTPLASDMPAADALRPHSTPWVYLQYQPVPAPAVRPFRANPPFQTRIGVAGETIAIPAAPSAIAAAEPDGIEQLVRAWNGTVLPISSPHDLAGAIHRLKADIPADTAPAASTAADSPAPPVASIADKGPELRQPSGNEDPVEVIGNLYDRISARAGEVPNHTCVETVERNRYEFETDNPIRSCASLLAARKLPSHRLHLRSTDWLRLDVGVAGGHEIFSWAGGDRFDERDIDQFIPEGAFGTGPFATLLLSVLDNRNSLLSLDGETAVDGRRVLQYSFQVPREESLYRVKAGQDWVATAYTGTLLVDPETSNLVRFRVRTEGLPAATEACEIDTTLDYREVELGQSQYFLPVSTRQRFIGVNGSEAENRVSFASCREFRGESTLSFDHAPAPVVATPATPAGASLPEGSSLAIELTTAISLGKAAAGDPIEGRLAEPVRDAANGKVLAPAGARVGGRLTLVELHHSPEPEYDLSLRWETLEMAGAETPLNLKPKLPTGASRGPWTGMELPREIGDGGIVYRFPEKNGAAVGALRTEWVTAGAHR